MIPMMVSAIRLQFFAKFHIQDPDRGESDCDNDENEVSHRPRYDISRIINVNLIIRKKYEFKVNYCMISIICYYF